jgi:SsrA-binding protein
MSKTNIHIVNRKARFEFEILEEFTAGIVLRGTEIKSIRDGKVSLTEAFGTVRDGEVFIRQMGIQEYSRGGYANHPVHRERKLLLNANEIRKIHKRLQEKGNTLVPLELFINDKGLAKLKIAVARGKRKYDKRHSLKRKDDKRQMDRALKRGKT